MPLITALISFAAVFGPLMYVKVFDGNLSIYASRDEMKEPGLFINGRKIF